MVHFHRLRMQRGPGADAAAAARACPRSAPGKSAYYMIKVLLAMFIGLARPAGARAGRRGAGDSLRGSDGDPDPDPRDRRQRPAAVRACWSWCGGALSSSATRCCGCSAPWCCLRCRHGRARWRSWRAWSGIAYPPNALFLVAFGFVLILLLHFSVAVSRLSDQTKVLSPAARPARAAPGQHRGAAREARARRSRRTRARAVSARPEVGAR